MVGHFTDRYMPRASQSKDLMRELCLIDSYVTIQHFTLKKDPLAPARFL